jgi:hypothetical protein
VKNRNKHQTGHPWEECVNPIAAGLGAPPMSSSFMRFDCQRHVGPDMAWTENL